jgi:hypothetical protein
MDTGNAAPIRIRVECAAPRYGTRWYKYAGRQRAANRLLALMGDKTVFRASVFCADYMGNADGMIGQVGGLTTSRQHLRRIAYWFGRDERLIEHFGLKPNEVTENC